MEYVQRVLWHEGMFITPNHFQQADRHAEAVLPVSYTHLTLPTNREV